MKQKNIINNITTKIQRNAYLARIFDELQGLEFDKGMMMYERDVASGKAFGGMETLTFITGKPCDGIYEQAVEEATQDILKSNYNIVTLLNLAGHDGEAYYEVHTKYNPTR